MKKVIARKVGKYEVGRTVGEGTFAKVKFAQNTETGEGVALKVMAKSTILKHKMVHQVFGPHRCTSTIHGGVPPPICGDAKEFIAPERLRT